ncbi:uncharacterized protein G2W53_010235 [Senna tora]|uniref:Uncharacterized protein n=1 Tax=Senna tora TaxID=362788 RepID=A0A835C945_9FABA|nr:uncharacterized protein G2W53_010235 [Senna tora]
MAIKYIKRLEENVKMGQRQER